MRQQKRHWCIEQSFGLCGRGRGWDDLGEWHWNTYNIMYEMSCQSRFDARYWMLGAGALGRPRGMVWGGRREEGSGWGAHVYLWRIHFDIWQNQYNIVKFKNKIKWKTLKIKTEMFTWEKKSQLIWRKANKQNHMHLSAYKYLYRMLPWKNLYKRNWTIKKDLFLIGELLLYNVVLVFAVKQCESA